MEGFKKLPKMQCFKTGGVVNAMKTGGVANAMCGGGKAYREGGKTDTEQDKAIVKKAFKMHEKQVHEGEKTDLSKLKKGGRSKKKEGTVKHYKTGGVVNAMKNGGAPKKYADGRLVGQGTVTDAERSLASGLTGQGAISATERARLANRARNRAMLSPAQQRELDAQEAAAAKAATPGAGLGSGMGAMGRKNGGKMKKCNTGGSTGPISQTAQEIIEGKRPAQATPGKMTPEERRASVAKAFGAK